MAKIVVECADPNDLSAVEEAVEQSVAKCNITYFNQHQALVEAGKSSSQRQSAKIIAEETGETSETVRNRIRRGKMEVGHVDPPQKDEWPRCKGILRDEEKCGLPVKETWKYDENDRGYKVPIDHGLCKGCRKKELTKKRALKEKAETDKAIEEFDSIPIDTKLDAIWNRILPQIEDILTAAEKEAAEGSLVGKVEPDTLDHIDQLFGVLSDIKYAVREESKRPGYS